MRDPLLTELSDRPDAWRQRYMKRPIEQLPIDVTIAFDKIQKLEREKDRLAAKAIALEKRYKFARLQIWVLEGVACAQFGIIGWFVKAMLARIH